MIGIHLKNVPGIRQVGKHPPKRSDVRFPQSFLFGLQKMDLIVSCNRLPYELSRSIGRKIINDQNVE